MGAHYIKNKDLEEAISKFQEVKIKRMDNPEQYDKEFLKLQTALSHLFYEMAQGILAKYKFHLVDTDDAMQEGVLIAMQKVDRFSHDYINPQGKKSKAFNYITTCIINHFRQMHRVEKRQCDLRNGYYEHLLEDIQEAIRDKPISYKKSIYSNQTIKCKSPE